MSEAARCPGCGLVPGDAWAKQCPHCGTVLAATGDDWNPYSAPESTLAPTIDGRSAPLTIPRSFFGKFAVAFRLLTSNIVPLTLIVSTVWLPASLLIESMEFEAVPGREGQSTRAITQLVQAVFHPIVMGALIFLLAKRIDGERVDYFRAMASGFGNWGWLLVANFVAGLIIAFGLIFLIVPGLIMQVRYSLLESVVVLEHNRKPRERSTRLTSGRRWPIFWASVLFYLGFLPLTAAGSALVVQFESPHQFWINVAFDCLVALLETFHPILLLLFYCEAREMDDAKRARDREGEPAFLQLMRGFTEVDPG